MLGTSQGLFPKRQHPKGISPKGCFPTMQFPKRQLPESVLASSIGPPSPNSSYPQRLGSLRRFRGPHLTFGTTWETAYLGSCQERNCNFGSRPLEKNITTNIRN